MRLLRESVGMAGLVVGTLLIAASAPASTTVTDLGGGHYRVVFRFTAPAGAKSVHLAGTFNGWNPTALAMSAADGPDVFEATLVLPKGRHEYKFVVDGKTWRTDPDNPYKTKGYRNAILFLGIEPPDPASQTGPAPKPVEMAGEVEHPKPIRDLIERLKGGESTAGVPIVNRMLGEKRMPWFTDRSATFVYVHPKAEEVAVQIAGYGSRTGYRMHRLVDGKPVFAVSLDRGKLPNRMAYTFAVFYKGGREETVIDPLAWSLTSRAGEPAALAVEPSDQRGRIEVIRSLQPSVEGLRPRDLYVYLPPGYDRNPNRRYPVLYLHDGQNCWDDPVEPFGHGGWCVNLTADRLIGEGRIRPFIAVGIANTPDRMKEYGSGRDILSDTDHPYIQFLKRDVKSRIDGTYRTRPDAKDTALMGSSMGGIISMQAALLNPDTFGHAACLSPAFFFKDDRDQDYFDLVRKVGRVPVRLYLDSGTGGPNQDGAPRTRRMAALLRELGWKDGHDFMHIEDAGAEHNERAWRARLEKPLVFLFGRQRS